jgi:hypothetical protein
VRAEGAGAPQERSSSATPRSLSGAAARSRAVQLSGWMPVVGDESSIRVERVSDGVALVVLDRPEQLNALDADLFAALPEVFGRLADDEDTRVVILTGAGSAGATRPRARLRNSRAGTRARRPSNPTRPALRRPRGNRLIPAATHPAARKSRQATHDGRWGHPGSGSRYSVSHTSDPSRYPQAPAQQPLYPLSTRR